MNSGGASSHAPPSLAARGFTRRRTKLGSRVDLVQFHLLFPSLLVVTTPLPAKTPKTQHRQLILVFISFVFQIFFGFFLF
jgi:hypothetical protein